MFHIGVDAPGAHHESALAASWLTPAKMSDAETLQAVETVLQALADDEWAGMAMRNENRVSHLVVAGDGAAAN